VANKIDVETPLEASSIKTESNLDTHISTNMGRSS